MFLKKSTLAVAIFLILQALSLPAEDIWYPYPVEVWNPPFDMESPRTHVDYVPLEKADEKWNIYVFFPHMKDSYWLAVNYGVTAEARRLGIRITLKQAGGYDHLGIQKAQIEACLKNDVDGIVIGAIAYDGLDSLVAAVSARGIPVVDVINGISTQVAAKSLVSFGEMGFKAGEYIAGRHPAGSQPVKVAWFPGPKDAGWVQAGDEGFRKAVENSAIEIVATRYGDTGKSVQTALLKEVLDAHSDLDYVVGTAVTAEVAVSVLRKRSLSDQVKIMAYYFTPGVYRGIKRGKILGAPTDSAVIQGRIAIDQIVRILQGEDYLQHVGPALQIIDSANVDFFDRTTSLAPSGFRAIYTVN